MRFIMSMKRRRVVEMSSWGGDEVVIQLFEVFWRSGDLA